MDSFEKEIGKYELDSGSSDIDELVEVVEVKDRIGQNQFYDIITSKKPDWQAIIYDLINTNQLDPWDIDIIVLTSKYFEKLEEIQEKADSEPLGVTDFYVSSKILLAASLLLRIKSEFLLNKHLKTIDEILFGKKEENKQVYERIEINEDDLPVLIPKTPLPRARKVTLQELIMALDKAINTESRRIKREVAVKRARKLSEVDFPTFKRIDLKDRIKQFYAKILTSVKKNSSGPEKPLNKIGYSGLVGQEKEERLACFLPVLHLSNTRKLWLEQETHLQEIWIYLYEYFKKNSDKFIEELEEDIEEMKLELEQGAENLDQDGVKGLEKARLKREEKKRFEQEIKEELESELKQEITNEIKKQEEIEKLTGFEDEL